MGQGRRPLPCYGTSAGDGLHPGLAFVVVVPRVGDYPKGRGRTLMAPPTEASSAELRRRLHQIVGELPDQELQAAHRYLEYLRQMADPLLRALLEAAEDDEPETHGEAEAAQEAREDVRHGRVVPHDEARRRILQA